jgi:hypothetical protein
VAYSTATIICQIGYEDPATGSDWLEGGVASSIKFSSSEPYSGSHIGIHIPSLSFGTGGERRFSIWSPLSWGGSALMYFVPEALPPGPNNKSSVSVTFALTDEANPAPFATGSAKPSLRSLFARKVILTVGLANGEIDFMDESRMSEVFLALLRYAVSGGHPWREGNSVAIVIQATVRDAIPGDDATFNILREPWGSPGLSIPYSVGAEPSSIADRRQGTRWFQDARSGHEYPVGDFAQDGEHRNLYVYHRDVDKPGRRATRRNTRRERQDRLWPRVN